MIQSDLKLQGMLNLVEITIKTSVQAKLIYRIIPLQNKLAFIYYEGGFYELYDIKKQEITLSGKLPEKIGFFLEIYTKILVFLDPTDLQVKLLDLNMNQINPKFVFRSSDQINVESDKSRRELFVDKFRVFFIDCPEKQIKYLISQDLEKYYSNNNVCHYTIRVLPLDYYSETNFQLTPVAQYDYPNKMAQTELYKWQVDRETIAVYGQDNEKNQSEILLIKPHLMEKAFYIIHTEFSCSYTTMNVSNWVNLHQVAIWVNCNDGTTRPSIFIFDLRNYYDGQNWIPEPKFTATLASDKYIANEPSIFMDIYQFNLESTYAIQFRQVENQAKISIINYENFQEPQVVSEVIVDSFWIDPAVDHSYILLYNDMLIEDQTLKFKILFQ